MTLNMSTQRFTSERIGTVTGLSTLTLYGDLVLDNQASRIKSKERTVRDGRATRLHSEADPN